MISFGIMYIVLWLSVIIFPANTIKNADSQPKFHNAVINDTNMALYFFKSPQEPEVIFGLTKNSQYLWDENPGRLYVSIDGGLNMKEHKFYINQTLIPISNIAITGSYFLLISHSSSLGFLTNKTLEITRTFHFKANNSIFIPHPKYYNLVSEIYDKISEDNFSLAVYIFEYSSQPDGFKRVKTAEWFAESRSLAVHTLDNKLNVYIFDYGMPQSVVEISNVLTYSIINETIFAVVAQIYFQEFYVWSPRIGLRTAKFPKYITKYTIEQIEYKFDHVYVALKNSTNTVTLYVASMKDLHFSKRISDLTQTTSISECSFSLHPSKEDIIFINKESKSTLYPSTFLSTNNGYDWAPVLVKTHTSCLYPECYLYLELPCKSNYENDKSISWLFSVHGSMIKNNRKQHFHFYTTDSGKTWNGVIDSDYALAILNHGTVMVAANQRSASIQYSTDYGESWKTLRIYEETEKIILLDSTVSPRSDSILVVGVSDHLKDFIITLVDFKSYLGESCADDDYDLWIFSGFNSECIKGKITSYYIKKPNAVCYDSKANHLNKQETVCECYSSDFGCELGWFKDGENCVFDSDEGNDVSHVLCSPGNIISRRDGYVKLSDDGCKPSSAINYVTTKERKYTEMCRFTDSDTFLVLYSATDLYTVGIVRDSKGVNQYLPIHRIPIIDYRNMSMPFTISFSESTIYFAIESYIYKVGMFGESHRSPKDYKIIYKSSNYITSIKYDPISVNMFAITLDKTLFCFNIRTKLKRIIKRNIILFTIPSEDGIILSISSSYELCLTRSLDLKSYCVYLLRTSLRLVYDHATKLIYVQTERDSLYSYRFDSKKSVLKLESVYEFNSSYMFEIHDGNIYCLDDKAKVSVGNIKAIHNLRFLTSFNGLKHMHLHNMMESGRHHCHHVMCDYMCAPSDGLSGSCICPDEARLSHEKECLPKVDNQPFLHNYCEGLICDYSVCTLGVSTCSQESSSSDCRFYSCSYNQICCEDGKCYYSSDKDCKKEFDPFSAQMNISNNPKKRIPANKANKHLIIIAYIFLAVIISILVGLGMYSLLYKYKFMSHINKIFTAIHPRATEDFEFEELLRSEANNIRSEDEDSLAFFTSK